MKIFNVVYLLGLTLMLTGTAGCSKAGMGSKSGKKQVVVKRQDRPIPARTSQTDEADKKSPAKEQAKEQEETDQQQDQEVESKENNNNRPPLIIIEKKEQPPQQEQKETQRPTPTTPIVKPTPIVEKKAGRVLPVFLSYADETARNESTENQNIINELWSKSDILKGQRAAPVSDEAYGTTNRNNLNFPIISTGLFHAIIPGHHIPESEKFYPCDLNAVGPCLVLEKDSVTGKAVMTAYVVASALKSVTSTEIRIARRDITDKALKAKIETALRNRMDGIYAFSLAATKEESVELQEELPPPTEEIAEAPVAQKQDDRDSKIECVTDQEEKALIKSQIEEAVAKSTVQHAKEGSRDAFNKCAIISVPSEAHPTHGLKTKYIVFGPDFAYLFSGGKRPHKVGKGILACNLWNGDVQRVNIEIKEFLSPLTLGAVLAKGKLARTQSLVASGIGFANGARDILEIKQYPYAVNLHGAQTVAALALGATGWGLFASAAIGNITIAPLILSSGGSGHKPILAGAIGGSSRIGIPDTRVTVLGHYEIGIDPDDTALYTKCPAPAVPNN